MRHTATVLPKVSVQAAPARAPSRSWLRELAQTAGLNLASVALLSVLFPPWNVWPLAFVALVPWALGMIRTERAWIAHWLNYAGALLFFLVNLQWLAAVTGLGYGALCGFLAMFWVVAGWALRSALRYRVSPAWSLPVVWVGCDFLRAVFPGLGFPWFYVGHALHAQLTFIQVSDLTGVYGVSFLLLLVNGTIVEFCLQRMRRPQEPARPRQLRAALAVTAVLLTGNLAYGAVRIRQGEFAPGPLIAVVQEDFPQRTTPPYSEKPGVIFARYLALAAQAAQQRPDLLVFPETVWGATQNIDFLSVEFRAVEGVHASTWAYGKLCHDAVAAFARGDYAAVNELIDRLQRAYPDQKLPRLPATGGPPVTVLVGSTSLETLPESAYPRVKRYNSALVYDSTGEQRRQRYDKIHLVPFGEVVPFRGGRLHRLYVWLNSLSPFSNGGTFEYSLWPGDGYTIFELATAAGTTRFGTPICYEDVMPYVPRRFVWQGGQRRADVLVNISNDGWFEHSAELPQHLVACAFRAVENRVSIARAVNTGISGFIDPNGRIHSLVRGSDRLYGPNVVGYSMARVEIDQRTSVYGRTGDWFAALCLALTAGLWIEAVVARWINGVRRRINAWLAKGAAADAGDSAT